MEKVIDGIYDICVVKEEFGLPLKRYGEMKLYVDEDNGWLKGTMFPRFFWLNCPFRNGQVKGNKFSFTCYFSSPCQQFAMEVDGVWDGTTVSGTLRDPGGSAEFFGTKQSD